MENISSVEKLSSIELVENLRRSRLEYSKESLQLPPPPPNRRHNSCYSNRSCITGGGGGCSNDDDDEDDEHDDGHPHHLSTSQTYSGNLSCPSSNHLLGGGTSSRDYRRTSCGQQSTDSSITKPKIQQSISHHSIFNHNFHHPHHHHGEKGSRRVAVISPRNRHFSGSLPSDPILLLPDEIRIIDNPMQNPVINRIIQVKLEDDGYCSSVTSKNSEGNNPLGLVELGKDANHHPPPSASPPPDGNIGEGQPMVESNDLEPNPIPDSTNGDSRETWGQSLDFLLSIIGFAVDLANVCRFPYFCYKNGGGAFLIPYFLMLIFGAIPIFYMELLLGQSIRQGPISVWKICPLFKGIGYCAVMVSYFVSWYYNTTMGWSLHYTVHSLSSPLPWTTCGNAWNTESCFIPNSNTSSEPRPDNATSPASEYYRRSVLEMQDHSMDNLGGVKLELLVYVAIIYCLLYLIIFKGIRSTGKVVWVTATLPYVVLAVLLLRGLFLEGAWEGITYYVSPNLTKLNDVQVWSDAAKQIFFSSGAGFGVHLTYASYNNFHNNCFRDCLITSAVNCFTSIFSGFVIFTFLGSMAKSQNRNISDVVTIGPGLVFEVYPEAIGSLPGANFWSLLFFLMLIMLGIDSAMGGLECVITGITDEFSTWFRRKRHRKEWFKFGIVFSSFLFSIVNITRGGMYTYTFLDSFAAGISLLLAVLFEVLVVSWVYGLDKLCGDAGKMLGSPPGIFWRICWKFISPLLIAIIILLDLTNPAPLTYDNYIFPDWAQIFGIIFTFIPIMCVPILALVEVLSYPGTCSRKVAYSITPIEEHEIIKNEAGSSRFLTGAT